MNNCERCGAELFDYYYVHATSLNSTTGNKHFYICPSCFKELEEFMKGKNIKAIIKRFKDTFDKDTYTISFDLPEGYKIMRGDENNK